MALRRRASLHEDGYDVVVIGAGVNGLVCAGYLARRGKRVLVVEARQEAGGAAITRPLTDEFKVSAVAHLANGFDERILRDFRLRRHGLFMSARAMPTVALVANGSPIVLTGDIERDSASIARHWPADALAYESFARALRHIAEALWPLLAAPVLAPQDGARRTRRAISAIERGLKRLTTEEQDLCTVLVRGAIGDVLDRRFETPQLKGALGLLACLGHAAGPYTEGTGLTFLLRMTMEGCGAPRVMHPQGGLGAFARALCDGVCAQGVKLRTGVSVAKIMLDDGHAAGVLLDSGERIPAHTVVSAVDPKATFLELVPAGTLDVGFMRRVRAIRMEGMSCKVHLALDSLPDFRGLPVEHAGGRLLIAPSLGALQDAFAQAKRQGFSDNPALEITLPSIYDSTLAPAGQHVMSAVVHYASLDLDAQSGARERFIQRIVDTLTAYVPDLRAKIVAGELVSPRDLESRFGMAGGCWHHGAMTPDQLYGLRPVAGAGRHATPVPGLYLCGAGSHPGGGITGLPGRNAASAILAEERGS
jgi:phytoene dehydrogenase-like protein